MTRILVLRGPWLGWVLLLWIVLEILTYVAVVDRVGVLGGLLIGILSTVLGFASLRRLGASAFMSLRRRWREGTPSPMSMLDGSLSAFGALLLILPGFLSDALGLALMAPSVRQWLAGRVEVAPPVRPARPGDATIDLTPAEWRPVEEHREPQTRGGPG